jgi:predicted GIY-YIG superfamily endonuclease
MAFLTQEQIQSLMQVEGYTGIAEDAARRLAEHIRQEIPVGKSEAEA